MKNNNQSGAAPSSGSEGATSGSTNESKQPATIATGHANGDDWEEEAYQKLKQMKETYIPALDEIYQKLVAKLEELESHPQQLNSEQLIDRLKSQKGVMERIVLILEMPKSQIQVGYKEKLVIYEEQLIKFINMNRPGNPITSPMQQVSSMSAASQQSTVHRQQSSSNAEIDRNLVGRVCHLCGLPRRS